MARDRAGDEIEAPAYTHDRKTPHCCRCGKAMPTSRVLWDLCQVCKDEKFAETEEAYKRNQGKPIDPRWKLNRS